MSLFSVSRACKVRHAGRTYIQLWVTGRQYAYTPKAGHTVAEVLKHYHRIHKFNRGAALAFIRANCNLQFRDYRKVVEQCGGIALTTLAAKTELRRIHT